MLTIKMRPLVLVFVLLFSSLFIFGQAPEDKLNYAHDKMIALMQQSQKIELPAVVIATLQDINKNEQHKEKIIGAQLNMLKVVYNPALTKEDINFFGEMILSNNSSMMAPIHAIVKKKLSK